MTDGVSIRIDGLDEGQETLAAAVARLTHPKPMFDAIGASLVTSTERRFERGESPDGSNWPASVRALLEGGKTLIESGLLMRSITFDASDDHVEVGTNAIHAAVHQLGATIIPKAATKLRFFIGGAEIFADKVTIPARPYLGIDADDSAEIAATVEDYVLLEAGDAD